MGLPSNKASRKESAGRKYDRRKFLKEGAAAGVFAATLPFLPPGAVSAAVTRQPADPPILSVQSEAGSPAVPPFEFDEVTIAELQAGMESGKYTARSITEKFLSRIGAIDGNGPLLRSVIEVNPEALDIAAALDAELKEKGARGPLHGMPILIKDNVDTADGMSTTAGSTALLGSKRTADAFLVQRLRKAGAVIIGKTNLSEWANIRSGRSTSGWSARGGLTKNPYALDRNTSGSSSGSAAAVAASLCAAAVGTETDGSIVSPSSINGIVGIKPTVGLVSRTGVIPISHTQDTAGPMARTVRDAAILLGALAGVDPEDSATAAAEGKVVADYTAGLDARALDGAKIGIVRSYFGFHDGVDEVMENSIRTLKEQGAKVVDPVGIPTLGELGDAELTVLLYELKADMAAYLSRLAPGFPVKTLKDIIEFNGKNKFTEMPFFGQDLFLKAEAKGPLTEAAYLEAKEKCRRLAGTEGIDAAMKLHGLDALVAPTDGPAWMTDLVNGDHFIGGSSTAAAVAGYPGVTVPAGYVFGLPVGISFFGTAWSEPLLIRLAYAFEQATKVRRPPRFLPTVKL
jgi:amidase